MSILEDIKNCKLCPLYKNMPLGPVVDEYCGDVYCLFSETSKDSNITDEFLSLLDKKILETIVPRNRWYTAALKRCVSKKSSSADIKSCIKVCPSWIYKEIEEIKPKKIVVFGLGPSLFVMGKKVNFSDIVFSVRKSSFGDTLFLPSLYQIANSTEHFNSAKKASEEYIGVC